MKTMARIGIKERFGSDIVTREHGKKLHDLLASLWNEPPITVDFDGLQVNSVSFFDESFGRLTLEYGKDELLRHVRLEGLDQFDQALVGDIVASRSREAEKRASKR